MLKRFVLTPLAVVAGVIALGSAGAAIVAVTDPGSSSSPRIAAVADGDLEEVSTTTTTEAPAPPAATEPAPPAVEAPQAPDTPPGAPVAAPEPAPAPVAPPAGPEEPVVTQPRTVTCFPVTRPALPGQTPDPTPAYWVCHYDDDPGTTWDSPTDQTT